MLLSVGIRRVGACGGTEFRFRDGNYSDYYMLRQKAGANKSSTG